MLMLTLLRAEVCRLLEQPASHARILTLLAVKYQFVFPTMIFLHIR